MRHLRTIITLILKNIEYDVGYKEDDKPDKDDIEVQRNSEFIPTWYVEYDGEWYVYQDGRLE